MKGLGDPTGERTSRVEAYRDEFVARRVVGRSLTGNTSYFGECARSDKGYCLPKGAHEEVDIHDPKTGEVFWTGKREEAERLLKETEEQEGPGHGLSLRPAQISKELREAQEQAAREELFKKQDEAVAEKKRIEGLATPHGLRPGHPNYREPPERLYHATFSKDEILKGGFKSADELGVGGVVLGGSTTHTVSFTTKENAELYRDGLNVARKAAQGKMTDEEMVKEAQKFGVSKEEANRILKAQSERDRTFKFWQEISFKGKQFPLFMGSGWPAKLKTAAPADIVSIESKNIKDIYYVPGETEWRVGDYKGKKVFATHNVFCPTGKGGGRDPTCSPGGTKKDDRGYHKDVKGWGDDDARIMAHAEKMIRSFDRDPKLKEWKEELARYDVERPALYKDIDDLTKKWMETDNKDERFKYDQWIGERAERIQEGDKRYKELTHNISESSRDALIRAFGVSKDKQVHFSMNPPKSGDARKKWEQAEEFLSKLTNKDATGNEIHGFVRGVKGRAHHSGVTLYTSKNDDAGVMIHEFGHHLEKLHPWTLDRARQFHAENYSPSGNINMKTAFPKFGYKPDEIGNPDSMHDVFKNNASYAAYSGKVYKSGDNIWSTELTSMGLEQLYRDPVHLARKHPKYFALIISALQRGPKRA